MKILMVGSQASTSANLKKGLVKRGHTVVLVMKEALAMEDTSNTDYVKQSNWMMKKLYGNNFDIVHVHSPRFWMVRNIYPYVHEGAKLVCHWHGSDLRHPYSALVDQTMPMWWCIRNASFHLYSTNDLSWWLRVPRDKKMLFNPLVDCDMFYPMMHMDEYKKQFRVVFDGGGESFDIHRIPHDEMPRYLNQYRNACIHNADNLDDTLLSVIALECAACNVTVEQFPWLNRDWVLTNASVDIQAEKLEMIYQGLLIDE